MSNESYSLLTDAHNWQQVRLAASVNIFVDHDETVLLRIYAGLTEVADLRMNIDGVEQLILELQDAVTRNRRQVMRDGHRVKPYLEAMARQEASDRRCLERDMEEGN